MEVPIHRSSHGSSTKNTSIVSTSWQIFLSIEHVPANHGGLPDGKIELLVCAEICNQTSGFVGKQDTKKNDGLSTRSHLHSQFGGTPKFQTSQDHPHNDISCYISNYISTTADGCKILHQFFYGWLSHHPTI